VAYIPLSDDETRVILSEESVSNLGSLGADRQEQILRKLIDIADHEAPPSELRYEQISSLDIYAVGSDCRLYAKAVDSLPPDGADYHLLFVFYIDETHEYDNTLLHEYNERAKRRVDELSNLTTVEEVETLFDRVNALSADDLCDLLPSE
jgi:hypothetical protein